ncbi:MAG: dihydropteroate synthase [Alphaproteobacteria bacterium]|nr:dihydropteroate synthase [Alphaproteobacteria bacterium]
MSDKNLEIIGENFNTSRRIIGRSPRIEKTENQAVLNYVDHHGTACQLDITDIYPEDPSELKKFRVPHVAHAIRRKDLDYIRWIIQAQVDAGATIIDICLDEISTDPDERNDYMRWVIPLAQEMAETPLAIDSSDPGTIVAGLEVYDRSKSRPAINSVNLEEGRGDLIGLAKDHDAMLYANASGRDGMPDGAQERVDNLVEIMDLMDAASIPMEDRYLDPLAFPIGAGTEFGNHYLDAVREVRRRWPEVHIFGGHSNISFGLPRRKAANNAFLVLSILAGCDTLMIDPIMNPPADLIDFRISADTILGKDDFAMNYLKHFRP